MRDQPAFLRLLKFVRLQRENYFRAQFIETEPALAQSGEPLIFAANHSGMNFPWDDFVLFDYLMERYRAHRQLRILVWPGMMRMRFFSPFAMNPRWNYFSEEATMKTFEELMVEKYSVVLNPEGLGGIGKGFQNRYQLQKMSSSFVRMSLKYNRAIVPVSIVNGEYLNPFAYSFSWLNRLVKPTGLPFLPVGPTLLLLLFPMAAYISLPARLRYVLGARIYASDFTEKSYDEVSDEEVREITLKIQALMQARLDKAVENYGQVKFGWGEFFGRIRALGSKSWALFPLTWGFQAHRAYLGENYNFKSALFSFAICSALSLPVVGWPLLIALLSVAPLFESNNGRKIWFQKSLPLYSSSQFNLMRKMPRE